MIKITLSLPLTLQPNEAAYILSSRTPIVSEIIHFRIKIVLSMECEGCGSEVFFCTVFCQFFLTFKTIVWYCEKNNLQNYTMVYYGASVVGSPSSVRKLALEADCVE